MQLINASFRGSLYQDLKYTGFGSKLHWQSEDSITKPFHSVNIEKNSLLNKILPNHEQLMVNSFHHKAVKVLG